MQNENRHSFVKSALGDAVVAAVGTPLQSH
jgi:hypothetical protein